jgi:hypothetical protein
MNDFEKKTLKENLAKLQEAKDNLDHLYMSAHGFLELAPPIIQVERAITMLAGILDCEEGEGL